jgi:CDP-diacylglycerol--glycerol-3-phosphate 3-phosphatidyltransferase/cardiolipin synthase
MAPIFFLTVLNGFYIYSLFIFIFAGASDILDGFFARKYGLISSKGAYFDISSDFIFILAGFSAFVVKGIYPYWVLIIIIIMFFQFLITSRSRSPIYDPVGKYYGSFLYLTMLIGLIITNSFLYSLLTVLIVIFSLTSIISRLIFMKKMK